MPSLNIAQLLPARYVINHHVPSPLTCRHKHRCGCHPAPPEKPAKPLSEKVQEKIKDETDRRMMDLIGFLNLALQDFPDARAALDKHTMEWRKKHPQ